MPPNPMTVVPRQTGQSAVPAAAGVDWPTDNKFLNGPFAPWTEENEAYDLEVDGEIPSDLAGALFRVSSNPRFEPRNTDRVAWPTTPCPTDSPATTTSSTAPPASKGRTA